jgi:WD40 repeat protein
VVEEEKKPKEIFEGSIAKGVKLSVSPADSLLATGDSTGTIGIWFASPTYGIFSRIYNIDREGASSVERIAFSGDGDTLVTSDQQRVSAWMSRDKLSAAK